MPASSGAVGRSRHEAQIRKAASMYGASWAAAVPVAVVLAAVGVVGGVALLGDSWAALAGWVAAVAVTVVVVRAAAPG